MSTFTSSVEMAFKVQLSVSSVPELNSSFYHVSRYLLFFFFLLLIIKYSETDAVKHNRQQRFKAGTVSKDVFLFYCVQEHVESEPLKSWQIIYLLNSCMELSWSILWGHNMCTRSLMCTWIWIKIFICAPFIILIQIRQTEFISLCCIMWIKMMHTRDYHDPDQDHIFCFKVIF